MAAEEDRCPNCGALVVEGADWCGQCYTPLKKTPEPEPVTDVDEVDKASDGPESQSAVPPLPTLPPGLASPAAALAAEPDSADDPSSPAPPTARSASLSPGSGPDTEPSGTSTWTCPSCERKNPLDLEICAMCGTPFSRLFDEGPVATNVAPERAVRASILPGLGHWICGQRGEAVTRFLFVLWGISVGLLAFLAKSDAAAKIHPVGAVYIVSALAVYVVGFFDAQRAAQGHTQSLSVKILLYWFAALIFIFLVSVFTAFLSVTKQNGLPGGGTSPGA